MFGIEQKQCYLLIHGLREILHRALEAAGSVPAQTDAELQEVLSVRRSEEDKILLHDGTEREVPRPQEEEAQRLKYSGKKKKHTVKNAVIISCCCMVLYASPTFDGRVHDKKIADTAYRIPPGFTLAQDTGYQGYRPEGVTIFQPQKKPKGKELTPEQKQHNRLISSFRVRVEHAIGSIKRYRTVKDECRLRKNLRNYSGTIHTLDVSETFQSGKNILSIFDSGIDNRANPCKAVSTPSLRVTELAGDFCFDFDIPDSPF
jgi:hypothetical protein